METLAMTVNGESDGASKNIADMGHVTGDGSKDVDSILEDIDNLVNGKSPAKSTTILRSNEPELKDKEELSVTSAAGEENVVQDEKPDQQVVVSFTKEKSNSESIATIEQSPSSPNTTCPNTIVASPSSLHSMSSPSSPSIPSSSRPPPKPSSSSLSSSSSSSSSSLIPVSRPSAPTEASCSPKEPSIEESNGESGLKADSDMKADLSPSMPKQSHLGSANILCSQPSGNSQAAQSDLPTSDVEPQNSSSSTAEPPVVSEPVMETSQIESQKPASPLSEGQITDKIVENTSDSAIASPSSHETGVIPNPDTEALRHTSSPSTENILQKSSHSVTLPLESDTEIPAVSFTEPTLTSRTQITTISPSSLATSSSSEAETPRGLPTDTFTQDLSATNFPVSSEPVIRQQTSGSSDTETNAKDEVISDTSNDQCEQGETTEKVENNNCDMEVDVTDAPEELELSDKAEPNISLSVAIGASSDPKEDMVLEETSRDLKTVVANEKENTDDKEDQDMDHDPNSSDSNICSIQIVEGSSIANADMFMEEDVTFTDGEQKDKEVDTSANGTADQNVDRSNTESLPIQNGDGNCENIEKGNSDQEASLAVETSENKDDTKLNKPSDNDKLKEKQVSITELANVKEDKGSIDHTDSEAVILISEGESRSEESPVEKVSFKNILKVTAKEDKKPANLLSVSSEKNLIEAEADKMKSNDDSTKEEKSDILNQEDSKIHNVVENSKACSDKTVSENGKKRSFSPDEVSVLKPKRTKLDETNDRKECLQNGAMEVIDSDDDVILTDDIFDQKLAKLDRLNLEAIKDSAENKEGDFEEIKTAEMKKDKDVLDSKTGEPSSINLSSQVLQAFITARIKAFVKKQKQQQIDKLNKRIAFMQSSTSLWKETAKHLERSVKEVTVINQGVEKRRAHINACKKLSSRTVGTQVSDDKVKSALVAVQGSPTNNHARGPETVASNPPLGPSVLLNPSAPQQATSYRPRHWNFHQLHVAARAQAPSPRAAAPVAAVPQHRPSQPPAVRPTPPAQSDVVNLIDLTDDEEVSKKTPQPPPPTVSVSHPYQSTPTNNRNNPATAGGKVPPSGSKAFIPVGPNRSTSLPNTTTHAQQQQYRPSVAGPRNQTPLTSTLAGQGGIRSNLRMTLVPNQPLPAGHSGLRAPAPQPGTAAGKPMQESPTSKSITMHTLPPSFLIQQQRHPAPLPQATESNPPNVRALQMPPKPTLKISRVSQGIVLSWNMPSLVGIEVITSYQLFAYQETDSAPKTSLWKKVGDVRALPLPMACTLTQFQEGNKYHFAVRAVDQYNRTGAFSDPSSIFLSIGSTNTKIASRG